MQRKIGYRSWHHPYINDIASGRVQPSDKTVPEGNGTGPHIISHGQDFPTVSADISAYGFANALRGIPGQVYIDQPADVIFSENQWIYCFCHEHFSKGF
jgi:hypothetical protein